MAESSLIFKVCLQGETIPQECIRGVAQPGRAHALGAWGRRFESCLPDTYASSG